MQKFIASILRCNGIYSPNAAADITELFGNALKGMYFATGVETICECEIPFSGLAKWLNPNLNRITKL